MIKKKIAFIGCGNMGKALLNGVATKRLFSNKAITVSDKRDSILKSIKKSYKVDTASSNIEAAKKGDIIILAVKPQDIVSVLKEISDYIESKLIISIAAGVTTSLIKLKSASKRVIRVMPNMPALVGHGVTAISYAKGATSSDISTAKKIFDTVGVTVTVKEKDIDAVTAVSGSGPAYFFMLMENMISSASSLGLKKQIAKELVIQTALGASVLQNCTSQDPAALRRQVTSKGGTTEAALKVFLKRGFEKTVKSALVAAHKRSKELSK